jgi:O-acetyl-ADP-ribose deacetylase (regulator of RNase III)
MVDAVAAEEDTFLVLSADPVVRDPKEHPVRLMTRVIETQAEAPGSVIVKGGSPLRLLAIVHDLSQEPSWREEWIASALDAIFREAESRKLQSIALPLIGTKHGSLEKRRFVVLLRHALERTLPRYLKRLWLIIPDGTSGKILEMIESE